MHFPRNKMVLYSGIGIGPRQTCRCRWKIWTRLDKFFVQLGLKIYSVSVQCHLYSVCVQCTVELGLAPDMPVQMKNMKQKCTFPEIKWLILKFFVCGAKDFWWPLQRVVITPIFIYSNFGEKWTKGWRKKKCGCAPAIFCLFESRFY